MSALLPVYPRLSLELARAEGCWLYTPEGRAILDLYGGHAVCPLGHAHPELTEALTRAHRTLDFYSNSLHLPMQEAAAQAVLGGSAHLSHVHFLSSGTEANEAAIHLARRLTGRETIVTLAESFHGRTLGSLSVTGLPAYRKRVPLKVPEHWSRLIKLDDPAAFEAIDDSVAGVLIESIPSLAGIRVPDRAWLQAVEARCREVGALFLFDEVQGGIGRLGRWYAHEVFGLKPDMVTLAKSLGGGFPVSAMVVTPEVASKVTYSELGTTFGGGPMACAMVEAVRRIVVRDGLMDRVVALFERVQSGLAGLPGVEVRGMGALIGVQTPLPAAELLRRLLEHDILVGTSGEPHTVRLLLPYVVSDEEIDRFLVAMPKVLA
jgi:acetylornithine/N-succinyldiaminopimelate aminotransferase